MESSILVKRWATGPNKGQAKPGTVIQGMLDHGLLELREDGGHWLRARFTKTGLAALQHMAEDARALPPGGHQHVLDEPRKRATDRSQRRIVGHPGLDICRAKKWIFEFRGVAGDEKIYVK